MRKKKLLIVTISTLPGLIFLLFVILVLNIYFLSVNLRQGKMNEAVHAAKNIAFLTGWEESLCSKESVLCRPLIPLKALRKSSLLIVEFSEVSQITGIIFQAVVSNQPDHIPTHLNEVNNRLPVLLEHSQELNALISSQNIKKLASLMGMSSDLIKFQYLLEEFSANSKAVYDLSQIFHELIGVGGKKHYTVLLQNNMEIRATGGFMGSFAQVFFENGGLSNYEVEDIYVPDGAIVGHVNPPAPIQEAFKQGWWRLRDSNWDPDFPTATQAIRWFFEKGGVDAGDGIIAINLSVVEEFFNIIGEINLPDYGQEVSRENLYSIAQFEAERDFFPGSTQKRNFLNSLSTNLFLNIEKINTNQLLQLLRVFQLQLHGKNIQINLKDSQKQKMISSLGWTGEMGWLKVEEITNDHFYSVESNLGANKANCCVVREVKQKAISESEYFQVYTEIKFLNQSPVERAKPPKYWGGDYKNYQRIYLSDKAILGSIFVDDKELGDLDVSAKMREGINLKEYGFFIEVPHLKEVKVRFSYKLPKETQDGYRLYVQKQPGLSGYWHTVEYINGEVTQQTKRLIDKNEIIQFK
jgi:hypothetical protein